jgi:hypothetical protein
MRQKAKDSRMSTLCIPGLLCVQCFVQLPCDGSPKAYHIKTFIMFLFLMHCVALSRSKSLPIRVVADCGHCRPHRRLPRLPWGLHLVLLPVRIPPRRRVRFDAHAVSACLIKASNFRDMGTYTQRQEHYFMVLSDIQAVVSRCVRQHAALSLYRRTLLEGIAFFL